MKIKHLLLGVLAVAAAVACKPDEIEVTPALDVNKTAASVVAEGGDVTVEVTSNVDWTASADQDWVSIDPASGKGSDKAVAVKVTVEPNEAEEARTAVVTVAADKLTKTVKITQAAKTTTPEPPVDEPEFEVKELYMLGSACDTGWSLDEMQAFANDGGIFTWTGNLNSEGEFRFPLQKVSNQWWPCLMISADGKSLVYGTSDDEKVIYNVPETGNYTITIDARDVKNMAVEVVYNGPVTEGPEVSWGLMGCFVDNLWATDVPMTKEGEWIVAKGAQFTELTFKIRGNASWNDKHNMGYAPGTEKGLVNARLAVVTAEYSKANLGGDCVDIKLNGPAGTYDVYFSYENLEVYVMEPGYKPGEREPIQVEPQEVTYTVVGTIVGTPADKKANYWNNANEAGLMTLEGDYYVAKGVEFDYDYRFSDDASGEDFVKFKICETGTWNAYGHAEEKAYQKPNTEIPVQVGGEDIYIDRSGVYDVYFDKNNGKVWVMESGYKPGEEIARLDGYQWMGEFDDMPVLFDLGITEEGMLSIALPTMDETGFALHMVGFYEIEETDKSSGVISFTQYDWEWDEIGEEFEIQYSELTANSVKVVCENVFGVAEAITLARVDYPYEILLPGGGESPEGPIANGGYWFVNSGKAMAPMAEDATSGMLPAKDLINYASTVKNTFTFTYDADMSYYTIQDSYGRYLGNESWGEDISLTTVLPTGEDYAYYLWCVDNSYDDGTVDVYNAATYNGFAYSSANDNWYLDPASYETDGIRPFLVSADYPVEEPVEPAGPEKLTIAEFAALADGDTVYELTGTITRIVTPYNSQYDNISINISDETAEIQLYRLSCAGVADPAALTVGDEITVQGCKGSYNDVAQMAAGGKYISHIDKEAPAPEAGTYELSFADAANRTSFSSTQQVWEQNGVKLTNDKAGSTSDVADYVAPARFYKGTSLKIEKAGMTKIVFYINSGKPASGLTDSISDSNASVSEEGYVVTVTFATAVDVFEVASLAAQIRMDSLTVYAE